MSYLDGLRNYYLIVCDATWFLTLIAISFSLLILEWPKELNKKSVLILCIKFLIIFASFFVCENFFFAFECIWRDIFCGTLFAISILFVPLLYFIFFSKGDVHHKFIKFSVLATTFLVDWNISRLFGMIIGGLTGDNFTLVVLARSLPMFFSIAIGYLLRKFDINYYKNLDKPIIVIVAIVSYSLIAIAMIECYLNNKTGDYSSIYWLFIFIYIVMLIILYITYYSLYKIVEYRHKITLTEISLTKSKIENEQLNLDKVNREELIKIRHDLKNNFSYIKILLDENKIDEAKKYLAKLTEMNSETLESFSSPNSTINSIVNLELSKAKIANKKLIVKAVVPPKLPFVDNDLCSLITNIIDNALEHSSNDDNPIKVSLTTYQDYFRVYAENHFDKDDDEKNKALKNKSFHGYGKKIIKRIAKSYDGFASFKEKDGVYVCDCILTLKKRDDLND